MFFFKKGLFYTQIKKPTSLGEIEPRSLCPNAMMRPPLHDSFLCKLS